MTCYITTYFDIGRSEWDSQFKRTFSYYSTNFSPFINLFEENSCDNDEMIVFMDESKINEFQQYLNLYPKSNIKLISINDNFMNQLFIWKTLDIETEIMKIPSFKNLLGTRFIYPEHNYPKYTLINHSKIDFICYAIENNLSDKNIFCWVDFGFFNNHLNIPKHLLDISLFDLNKINYTLINPIETQDLDIFYTLKNAREVIGGFFFIGTKSKLLEYQQLYHSTLKTFQSMKIADDDQHLVLQCFNSNPNLFSFNKNNFGWHKVLVANQKQKIKVISFCLWGNIKRYVYGLIRNIEIASKLYPDWICYVYLHSKSVNPNVISIIKKFHNTKVFLKNDDYIRPKRFMLWRLEPILDINVELFISRDIDTRIQLREILAVDEWVKSKKILHIMRDHPQHYPKILGGMYGIRPHFNMRKKDWLDSIEKFYEIYGESTDDQKYLELYLYNSIDSKNIFIHDEIKRYEKDNCHPYPIKYEKNGHFVGCYIYENEDTDNETANVLKHWTQTYISERVNSSEITLHSKLDFISSKISKIYIIHYSKLTNRKKNFINNKTYFLLDKFFEIIWVDNYDREHITQSQIHEFYKFDSNILQRSLTSAEIANGIAHNMTFENIMIDEKKEFTLVFEDDTEFKEDFIEHLFFVLSNLPNDADMICLGGPTSFSSYPCETHPSCTLSKFKSEDIIFFLPSTPAPMTLSSMLYRNKNLRKIKQSKLYKPFSSPSDHNLWICNIEVNSKLYYCQPFITYEASKSGTFDSSMERGF